MAAKIKAGDKLPMFSYDTPYRAQNRFRDLLAAQAPLVLVFMANFGNPVTRTFASRYAETYDKLYSGGFAMVVRSRADKLAASLAQDALPFPLMCDADGVLYDLLEIPTRGSAWTAYSLEAWQILRQAKKRGEICLVNAGQRPPDLPYYAMECRAADLYTLFGAPGTCCCAGMEQKYRIFRKKK